MATKTMNVRVSGKRDTLANWTNNNPVLLSGEVVQVIMTDGTLRHKTGNGTNTFTQLPYDDEIAAMPKWFSDDYDTDKDGIIDNAEKLGGQLPEHYASAAAVGEAIEAISPEDESVGAKPWSSKQIIDTLCPPLEETGNPVQCYPVAGYPLGVKVAWEPRQEGEGDPSPENVRPITGLDEVTVQRTGTAATLNLPSTVYGGEVDLETGEGMETWAYLVLDGTESWEAHNNPINNGFQYSLYSDVNLPRIEQGDNRVCTHFSTSNFSYWSQMVANNFATNGYSIRVQSLIPTSDEWKSYLATQRSAGTPVTVAYKLATPQPIQATGSQSLPALPGTNTIYTDADSVTVTGRADPVQTINALNDRIAALEDAATGG